MTVSTPSAPVDVQYVFQDLGPLARHGKASTIAKFLSEQSLDDLVIHRRKVAAALCALPTSDGLAVAEGLFSGRDENSPETSFWTSMWMHVHNEANPARLP